MLELGEVLAAIRSAYSDGAAAARSGKPLSDVPGFNDPDARQAWLNGWFDAAVFLRLVEDRSTGHSLSDKNGSQARDGSTDVEDLAA